MNAWENNLGMCNFGRGTCLTLLLIKIVIVFDIQQVSWVRAQSPDIALIDEEFQGNKTIHGPNFEENDVTKILNSLTKNYDKRIRPNFGGPPVEVGVTIFVISINDLSEVGMTFTLSIYCRQFWGDARLKFIAPPGMTTLSVGSEFINNIWVPDTIFANGQGSDPRYATTKNEFIRIDNTGFITRSIRLTITSHCLMELQFFPMDRQLCSIEMESSGYTTKDILYKWQEGINSVVISPEVSLPQFQVLGHRQKSAEISNFQGNHSRLILEIKFVRMLGYYLMQIYVPSGLIVGTSWVSFWLNRYATAARIFLGVTTVLIMTTLMSSTNDALPKISYVKSIDIYVGTCFLLVFFSFLEFATVSFMDKRIQLKKKRYIDNVKWRNTMPAGTSESTLQTGGLSNRFHHKRHHETREIDLAGRMNIIQINEDEEPTVILLPKHVETLFGFTASSIDLYSRLLFPVSFICFNLSYWLIYINITDTFANDLVLFVQKNP